MSTQLSSHTLAGTAYDGFILACSWKEPAMRKTTWMFVGLIALASAPARAADGAGLTPNVETWARWQGRLSFGTSTPAWRPGWVDFNASAPKVSRMSLMGDYYLTSSPNDDPGSLGGWRATSGVILGPRGQLWGGQASTTGGAFSVDARPFGTGTMPYANEAVGDTATLPYLGLGYTGLSLRGGWSFSADLGLVAQNPGNALRMGRALGGGQSLDDAVHELRISPLLQVGVSYAF
jgi:hypothetical protein